MGINQSSWNVTHELRSPIQSVFKHDPEVILTSLSREFGSGISTGVQPSEQRFDAVS